MCCALKNDAADFMLQVKEGCAVQIHTVIPFYGTFLLLILILTPILHAVNPNLVCSLTI